jgi:hypothetical protein
MKGVLVLSPPAKVTVHLDVSGHVTQTVGAEADFAVAKVSGGIEVGAEIGAVTQIEYEVTRISGVKLSQFPPIEASLLRFSHNVHVLRVVQKSQHGSDFTV